MTSTATATDEITSTLTRHQATRCPAGWSVTWLGDRTVTFDQARDAIELAELIENSDLRISHLSRADYERIAELTYDLCIWVAEAIELIQAHPLSKPPVYDPATGRIREDHQPKQTELDRTIAVLKDLNGRHNEGMDDAQYLAAVEHLIKTGRADAAPPHGTSAAR